MLLFYYFSFFLRAIEKIRTIEKLLELVYELYINCIQLPCAKTVKYENDSKLNKGDPGPRLVCLPNVETLTLASMQCSNWSGI